ncbi:MAG TPA: helix-turn-helix transcriptional regulator [Gemmatimonadales bacterium]|nr:helix-turn-helix transcriptional regulator [Gemmatimonadales bacterium]
MRILDIPRDERLRRVDLHIRRDKPSSYARRRALRSYAGDMQRASGSPTGPTQQQLEFANWVKDVVDSYTDPPRKWSVTRVADAAGVHRNVIYAWLNAKVAPQFDTVERFCQGLGLDFEEPARILGWIKSVPQTDDPERYIRLAREIAEHPGTSAARRAALEAQIKMVELTQRRKQEAERDEREADVLLRKALDEIEDPSDR